MTFGSEAADMAVDLPIELWQAIIYQLRFDEPTLYSCSLACMSWVSIARSHLFRRIALRSANYREFVGLLPSSTNPGQYVRDLILWEGKERISRHLAWSEKPFLDSCLPLLLQYLPHVTHLSLSYLQWNKLSPISQASLSGFPLVESLDVSEITLPSITQYQALVASYHNLHTLKFDPLQGYNFPHSNTPEEIADVSPPSKLQTLALGCAGREEFINWLCASRSPVEIRRLRLHGLHAICMSAGNRLLELLGPSLEEVHLDLIHVEVEG